VVVFSGLQLAAQDMQSCPMHKEHIKEQHQSDVEKHGDEAMGFPPVSEVSGSEFFSQDSPPAAELG